MSSLIHFSPDFNLQSADDVLPFYDTLINATINSSETLDSWLKDRSLLESIISENAGWRYIKMTCNTENESLKQDYLKFVTEIQPVLSPLSDKLNKKMLQAKAFVKADDAALQLVFKKVQNEVDIFREENVEIQSKLQTLSQQYASISGSLSIEYEGNKLTMPQASRLLKNNDRLVRKEVYEKIHLSRYAVKDKLNHIFTEMLQLRTKMARNAGFSNYRDYMFKALNRFDYTPSDCYLFHQSVATHIVPLAKQLLKQRKKAMLLNILQPFDTEVDMFGRAALTPFTDSAELYEKTLRCLEKTDAMFGQVLRRLHNLSHLDLGSRIGKAPGGYNYPLYKTGVPFIFMNASGSLRDVETLIHETGHAVHSVLTHSLPYISFKELPSEIAELASMTMELISRKNWSEIFTDDEQLKRALTEQLQDIIATLPWIATIDRFQHEIYTCGDYSEEAVTKIWLETLQMFSTSEIDYTGYEHFLDISWHKQLHLFEVPFYYIEYGIAQLGALAIWRNSLSNQNQALADYKKALSLGSSQSIPQIYETAGIKLDFSDDYLKDLAVFIQTQLN